ncbi:MAG: 16S rRNA (guanine(527)-N(7))-methyltransferase RsmG [Candidatus Latescibacterota bacterium]
MFHVKQSRHLNKKTIDSDEEQIRSGCLELGFSVTEAQVGDLLAHMAAIRSWSPRINLVGPNDLGSLASRHILDSLTALCIFPPDETLTLLDIGSGAGFPGIPLQIVRPNLRVTLLESRRKRALFLQKMVAQLTRAPFSVIHARAEELARDPDHTHRYDFITVRAVTSLDQAVLLAVPLLGPSGRIVLYRGPNAQEEAQALFRACPALPLEVISHQCIPVPFLDRSSHLVVLAPKKP